jgi:hypothetical protein
MQEDLVHRRAHRLGKPAQARDPLVAEWARELPRQGVAHP